MSIEGQGWRCLHQAKASLGEGLIWDERDGCLYWVDIFGPSVNWFHLASGRTNSWIPPKWISAMAIREKGGCDFGFAYGDQARFRVSAFKQKGFYGTVLRQIPSTLLSLDKIGLNPSIKDLLYRPRGLILVTGPTGSGKSTTLA